MLTSPALFSLITFLISTSGCSQIPLNDALITENSRDVTYADIKAVIKRRRQRAILEEYAKVYTDRLQEGEHLPTTLASQAEISPNTDVITGNTTHELVLINCTVAMFLFLFSLIISQQQQSMSQ